MGLLLDTCCLLWFVSDRSRLSTAARQHVEDPAVLFASAIPAFEIGVLTAKGRIQLQAPPEMWFAQALARHGIHALDVTWEIAVASTALPSLHNDPVDRLLISTALQHAITLVTPDVKIATYPGVQ